MLCCRYVTVGGLVKMSCSSTFGTGCIWDPWPVSLISSTILHLVISYCTLVDKMLWPILTENENMELTHVGSTLIFIIVERRSWRSWDSHVSFFHFIFGRTSCEVTIVLVSTFKFCWVIMHSFQSNYSWRQTVEAVLKCDL
jgi:hypothetical protein